LKEVNMQAKPGDQLRVRGNHVGAPDRCAEIIETRGPEGRPPFLVRWEDGEHVTLFFPGSDAVVEHRDGESAKAST
jgi:hypothetical protein